METFTLHTIFLFPVGKYLIYPTSLQFLLFIGSDVYLSCGDATEAFFERIVLFI